MRWTKNERGNDSRRDDGTPAACLLTHRRPLIPRPGGGGLFEAGEPTRADGEGVGRNDKRYSRPFRLVRVVVLVIKRPGLIALRCRPSVLIRGSSRFPVSCISSRLCVSCRIVVVVVACGGCRVLRFCSLASRRGVASFVCPAAWRCACPHPLPVVSFASRPFVSCVVSLLVPHVLRAAAVGRAYSSHRDHSSRRAWLVVP